MIIFDKESNNNEDKQTNDNAYDRTTSRYEANLAMFLSWKVFINFFLLIKWFFIIELFKLYESV